MKRHLLTYFCIFFFGTLSYAQVFVKQDALGNNDGTSWDDAYTSLQDALFLSPTGSQVWVAAGVYHPGPLGGPLDTSFFIVQDLEVYGGFAGTETLLSERDPGANPTILSGDLAQDDIQSEFDTNRTDNLYHVVVVSPLVSTNALLDGLIIEGGHAATDTVDLINLFGGGILAVGPIHVNNCAIRQNFALYGGGAAFYTVTSNGALIENSLLDQNGAILFGAGVVIEGVEGDGVTFMDTEFYQNISGNSGGGVCYFNSNGLVSGCTFTENVAVNLGGGLEMFVNGDGVEVEVVSSDFIGNLSTLGGAIGYQSNGFSNSFLVTDCDFTENVAAVLTPGGTPYGGAMIHIYGGSSSMESIVIEDCTFSENFSEVFGGAIANVAEGDSAEIRMENNFFEENVAIQGGAVYARANGSGNSHQFLSCDFEDNISSSLLSDAFDPIGAGVLVTVDAGGNASTAQFEDCEFKNNSGAQWGGGLGVFPNNPDSTFSLLLANCTFIENSVTNLGGGISILNGGILDFDFQNCSFSDNVVTLQGGGGGGVEALSFLTGSMTGRISDCLFENNIAEIGGGFLLYNSFPDFEGEEVAVVVERSQFLGNSSVSGNAVFLAEREDALAEVGLELNNCLVAEQLAGGAAIHRSFGADLILYSNTIANNQQNAIYSDGNGDLILQNNILFNPGFLNYLESDSTSGTITSLGANIIGDSSLNAVLAILDQGETDPLLVGSGNYALTQNSSAVDAGILPDPVPAFDLEGNLRLQGGCIDIGSLESSFDNGVGCIPTGISQASKQHLTLGFQPNPVQTYADVFFPETWKDEVQVHFYNSLGREVASRIIELNGPGENHRIVVSHFPAGWYRLVAIQDGQIASHSFLKKP